MSPVTQQGFGKLRLLLAHCKEYHAWCRTSASSPVTPSRLLYIGNTPEPTIRLIDSGISNVSYAALSYSWDGKAILSLTWESLSGFKKAIPWESFPRTYKDAILVARNLGTAYLWIDSICINQADKNDWYVESMKMGEIYEQAEYTINANAAASTEAGFLSMRKQEDCRPDVVTLSDDLATPARLTIRPEYLRSSEDGVALVHESFLASRQRHEMRTRPPGYTAKRGWCFQERFNSTRVIHFMTSEIIWECGQEICCECEGFGPLRQPIDLLESMNDGKGPKHLLSHVLHGNASKAYRWYCWRQLLEDYSERNFSRGTDKLIALGSLARKFSRLAPENKYAAGEWSKNYPEFFLWVAMDFNEARPADNVAPSWSWAATNGRIDLPLSQGPQQRSFSELLDVVCTATNGDEFGQILDGVLTLQAPLFMATLKYKDDLQSLVLEESYARCISFSICNLDSVSDWPSDFASDVGFVAPLRRSEKASDCIVLRPSGNRYIHVGRAILYCNEQGGRGFDKMMKKRTTTLEII